MTKDVTVAELEKRFMEHFDKVRRGLTLRLIDRDPVVLILPAELYSDGAAENTVAWVVTEPDFLAGAPAT